MPPTRPLCRAAHHRSGSFRQQISLRRSVAGDDRSIDRANRDAGHPIRQVLGCRKSFINASLVAAKGSSALQDERNLLLVGGRGSGHFLFTHKIIAYEQDLLRSWPNHSVLPGFGATSPRPSQALVDDV